MPGYSEPRWVEPEPGVREGSLESFALESAIWGGTREIQVYLPNEYKPHKTYPLLICHDGGDYLRFAGIKTVLDNLISRNEMHPTVVAFTSGSEKRNVEYGANPAQASFIVDELLPAVTERYGVSEEPIGRALMGASFGGVSSLYTAWTRPGVFGRLFLQSGSFVFTDVGHHGRGPLWDPVVDFVNAYRRDPAKIQARVFMSCGTFESLIFYNRALAPLMRQAGLTVRFVESHDGHNWVAWRDRLRDGLSWTYPGHLWMTYE
jgi:enterochelin esterase family protein